MTNRWTEIDEMDPAIHSFVVKKNDEWIVSVSPMLFNDRILLTHISEYPYGITAGWCYDKGGAALLAAKAWDPDKEQRPAGFKKEAYDNRKPTI